MPRVPQQCSSKDLEKFANYLAWNFSSGRDLLELSFEETVELYTTVVSAPPETSMKSYMKQNRLRQVIEFYSKYGTQMGIGTLYGFAEAYYKAAIFQLPLSRLMVIQARLRNIEDADGSRPATLRLDAFWTRFVEDARVSAACGDISRVERCEDRSLFRFMNRPVYEIAVVRRWVLDTNEKVSLPFKAFRMITFASYWFDTRDEIITHFDAMPELERSRQDCLNYLANCTSDCIDTEMLQEKVATARFADAFPEILAHALIRSSSSINGRQLASYLDLWGLDFSGDAKRIHAEACRQFVRRVKKKSPAWARVIQLKAEALLQYSPRIRLLDQNGNPWKHSYTVSMLDEYIRLVQLWYNPSSFSQAFC
ncbi:hypothetical protein FGB62_4g236 [Gracilaria domingensis]|nr:hypothetical protein FGB62_4g236 [Gracilaria domingensis]